MTGERGSDGQDVVIFADQVWDTDVPTNRQQLAARLPDHLDCRVLFVESPSFFPAPALGLGRRTSSSFHAVDDGSRRRESPSRLRISGSLTVLQPLLPAPHRYLKRYPRIPLAAVRRFLQRAVDSLDIRSPLVWSYSPFGAAYLPADLGHCGFVYDCVDRYSELDYYTDYALDVAEEERRTIDEADVVFATSQGVADGLPRTPEPVHVVGNAADVSLFRTARPGGEAEPASEIADLGDVVGFYGVLSGYKLDFDLLRALARTYPDVTLVLLGPTDGDLPAWVAELPNVRHVGRRPQGELPRYLAAFDVCLLPYERNEYTEGVEPLKLFEYIAAGKPVVSTDFATLPDHEGLRVADTDAEFLDLVGTALSGDVGVDDVVPSERSWGAKIERLLSVLRADGVLDGQRKRREGDSADGGGRA